MLSLDRIPVQHRTLRSRLSEAKARARRSGVPQLVSVTESVPWNDPHALLRAAVRSNIDYLYWEVPKRNFALIGFGTAFAIEGMGNERFTQVSTAWRHLVEHAFIENPTSQPGTGPTLMGGFAFDPEAESTPLWHGYPDARLVLPRVSVTVQGGVAWLTHNFVIDAAEGDLSLEEQPSVEELLHSVDAAPLPTEGCPQLSVHEEDKALWMGLVRRVVGALNGGTLDKVVLARAVDVAAEARIPIDEAVARLRSTYSDCFLFAFRRDESTFLGATPEQLVRLTGGAIETMCLAGSMPRGSSPEEDAALGAALLADAKERSEHRVVLDMIRSDLEPVCAAVTHAPAPTLLKLGNVQHLYTPIRARCKPGYTVFDVLARLHPTPAVGGSPRDLALAMIRQNEGFNRGWYASPVGWVDARSDGEFAVALRSALVRRDQATLFAGCGIMPSSDPEKEYQESCLKLRPMLYALGGQA